MATVTTTVSLTSAAGDLITDAITLSDSKAITIANMATTGLARAKVSATAVHASATVLYTADDYAAGPYLYIKNTATTAGHKIYVYDDTTSGDHIQFQLDAEDWGFIPMHGDKTYKAYSPGGNDPVVEFMVMGKDQ